MEQSRTVTFLLTDIEGSTRLLQQLGDRWPAALERHHQLMRSAAAAEVGEEIGTEGDSFFFVFPTVSGAVAAAAAAQRALAAEAWPDSLPLRVRMGLHTGEARWDGESLTGIDVHRAARIAAAGHGGQVLVSDATRVLVESSLPPDLRLRDEGSHRLKDLDNPEHLYQLVIDGLPDAFPPLRTLDATPNNLPVQLTTFLGRQREIGEVADLLANHRLLTLTGPGGTGKTRLSVEVARHVMDRFADGVFFVSLSPLHEVELVAPTIAHALGLPDGGGRSPEERIVDHLGEKHVLLVLDNFEQLVPAAPLVNQLLTRAPNLSCLVTSRESLHLYGEHEYAVPPLAVPSLDDRQRLGGEVLSQYEAVALFIERAVAVRPGFKVTNENAPAVAEICIRLDGLPLAIELAAARSRILSPEAILARLGDRLDLLSGGGSDRPERQQTLRGAIAWSYELLEDADRKLFAGMSVFVGGGTLEAIEAVCGELIDGDILDALASLVDKSLARQRESGGEPRFSMLHTIREFAVERAAELEMLDDLRRRHAAEFAQLVHEAAGVIMGTEKRPWLDRLELEHDNLRAAVGWAIERADAGLALQLTSDLWRFWQMRGYLEEGLERVGQALAIPGAEREPARLAALEAAGGLAYWQGDLERAEEYYTEVLRRQREAGDEHGVADALYNLSFVYAIPTASGRQADAERTSQLVDEALTIYRRIDDRVGIARCLWSLSNGSWISGEVEIGERYAAEALEVFREIDDRFMVGWTVYTIGMMRVQARRLDEAAAPLREALSIFSEAADISGYVLVLDGLAAEAYVLGDRRRAARLAAFVTKLQESSGTGLTPANRELIGFSHEPLIEDPELADDWAAGSRMTLGEAVAYGLEPVGVAG